VALLRHSTASLHDEADRPILPVWSVNDLASVSIEICGENLAITVMSRADANAQATLHIFNWKNGRRKGHRRIVNNLGLVFLREDLLLMPNISDPSFGIYHIPYSTQEGNEGCLELQPIVNLALPAIAEDHVVIGIQCRCDPSPTGGGVYPKYAPSKRPFANDPMEAIMVTEMRILDLANDHRADPYVMFVHRKRLIEQLPKDWQVNLRAPEIESASAKSSEASQRAEEEANWQPRQDGEASDANQWEEEPRELNNNIAPTVPWSEWGSRHARWLDAHTFSSVYITSTAGQRFVSIDKNASRDPSHIRVIDFNQYHVRQALTADVCPSEDMLVAVKVHDDTEDEPVWARKEPFVDQEARSELPFIEMSTKTTYNFNSVLLDEQRILGIRVSVESNMLSVVGN
jgi:hypothetical protein